MWGEFSVSSDDSPVCPGNIRSSVPGLGIVECLLRRPDLWCESGHRHGSLECRYDGLLSQEMGGLLYPKEEDLLLDYVLFEWIPNG